MNTTVNTMFTQFAAEATHAEGNLFTSIGIDWRLLILQTIAFLILLWFLKRYVYPPLMQMLDKRDETMRAAYQAAKEAEQKAAGTKDEVEAMLKQARLEAKDIVTTAKEEANAMVTSAESKSKSQAEALLASAQADIEKEVIAAKKELHNETIDLVAAATEKVVGHAVDAKVDDKVIAASLKEAK